MVQTDERRGMKGGPIRTGQKCWWRTGGKFAAEDRGAVVLVVVLELPTDVHGVKVRTPRPYRDRETGDVKCEFTASPDFLTPVA
jgi:hypothetical protein